MKKEKQNRDYVQPYFNQPSRHDSPRYVRVAHQISLHRQNNKWNLIMSPYAPV